MQGSERDMFDFYVEWAEGVLYCGYDGGRCGDSSTLTGSFRR